MTDARCHCGYSLRGLTGDRCPECGRPFPGTRKRPYLVRGFLWGFGILAVPTVVIGVPGYFIAVADVRPGDNWSLSFLGPLSVLILCGIVLAIAVVTGLIGMLIGYGVHRLKASPGEKRSKT